MKKSIIKTVVAIGMAASIAAVGGCTPASTTSASSADSFSSEASGSASKVVINVNADNEVHEISELLYGIFIEDINFAADGGLYAEMVVNRSFEFRKQAKNDSFYGWSVVGDADCKVISDDETGCLNLNNPSYLSIVNAADKEGGAGNKGFLDGMSVTDGASYDFSVYARGKDGYTGPVHIAIMHNSDVIAEGEIDSITDTWARYELDLTVSGTYNSGVTLQVTIDSGSADIDMVSLFPQDTFKGRSNGLRKDLATKLEELQPAFLRFPGGCVVEGVTLKNAYDWKDSIGVDENGDPLLFNGTYGDVAARKMGQNIWTDENATNDENPSYMSYGLGFYEYFLLAEDIGAIGVPVINCGLCCMAQGSGSGPALGTEEMDYYIQSALDLVEFCRGDESTTWGKVRIAMGHEEPFELKYVGIGNEQWGDKFFDHYEAFVDAFMQAKKDNPDMYGDIELMFTAGPDDADSGYAMYIDAYQEAADWLSKHSDLTIQDFTGAIDHHYYNTPSWFLSHTDYYDEENYSRDVDNMTTSPYGGGMKVFLGEYAARANNWEAALGEAAYMTGLERNGDIVVMAAYAPLFGNLVGLHWSPDLIWFNNNTVTSSVNYYVQKVFSLNAGTTLLESDMTGAEAEDKDTLSGMVGVATWETAARFDNIVVTDNESGEVLASDDFSGDDSAWTYISDGNWSVTDGQLVQKSNSTNTFTYGTTGTAAYFGDNTWTNYTYELDATKISGNEGFLIPFAVGDKNNNFFWNIGGWGNTVSCLQQVSSGSKSDQIAGTVKNCSVDSGTTYHLKIVVTDTNVKCYMDNKLYIDYDYDAGTLADCYQVVSTDSTGDIIVKIVNVSGEDKETKINISGADVKDSATVYQVAGASLADDNILGQQEVVSMEEFELTDVSNDYTYTVPKYSVTVIRFHR